MMYPIKQKIDIRPLVAILILCLVFTMAPLLPIFNSEVNATPAYGKITVKYEKPDGSIGTVATWRYDTYEKLYYDGTDSPLSIVKEFNDPLVYNGMRGNDHCRVLAVKSGILVDDLYSYVQNKTGVKVDKNSQIKVTAGDLFGGPNIDVSSYDDNTRYYIPSLLTSGMTSSEGDKTAVPAVLAVESAQSSSNLTPGNVPTYNNLTSLNSYIQGTLFTTFADTNSLRFVFGNLLDDTSPIGVKIEANGGNLSVSSINDILIIPDYSSQKPDDTPAVTPTQKFKVKFIASGGKFDNNKKSKVKNIDKDTKLGKTNTPKRTGYKFMGWFTKKSGGKKYTASTIIKKDTNLYAQWARKAVVNTKTKKLHLRDKASKSGKIIKKYPKGTNLIILGSSGNWYKVQVGDKTGYMFKKHIKLL